VVEGLLTDQPVTTVAMIQLRDTKIHTTVVKKVVFEIDQDRDASEKELQDLYMFLLLRVDLNPSKITSTRSCVQNLKTMFCPFFGIGTKNMSGWFFVSVSAL